MRFRRALALTASVGVSASVLLGTGTASTAATQKAVKTPGTLIAQRAVATTGVNGTAYLVSYWSESYPANKAVKVTGLVVVPQGTPPAGGFPVVTWAHGTNGTNGTCAPSLAPSSDIPQLNSMLAQGWEVVATDYLGEGNSALKPTKGILPYLVGTSAARNTLDIVKAVQNSSTFHASSSYVVWGHSEGGQTAVFALHIADTYAPTLDLKGVLALAPPSNFSTLIPAAEQTANWPFLFLAAGGFQAAYGKHVANVKELLTSTGLKDMKLLKTQCLAGVGIPLLSQGFTKVFSFPAGSALPSDWQALADQNDAATFTAASPEPLLIVSGDMDTLVIPSTTASLATELCALAPAQDTERWLYAGLDHGGIMSSSTIADYVQWTANRFADDASHDYTPVGSGTHTASVTNTCG